MAYIWGVTKGGLYRDYGLIWGDFFLHHPSPGFIFFRIQIPWDSSRSLKTTTILWEKIWMFSENRGVLAPNHPFLIGFFHYKLHHPFWGTTFFGNTYFSTFFQASWPSTSTQFISGWVFSPIWKSHEEARLLANKIFEAVTLFCSSRWLNNATPKCGVFFGKEPSFKPRLVGVASHRSFSGAIMMPVRGWKGWGVSGWLLDDKKSGNSLPNFEGVYT